MIPYGRQDITEEDIRSVVDVLHSDFITQGAAIEHFEQAVADRCRARHAIAVNSATSALHLACLGLGLGPGDWLWTSPNTFVASANCALYCGARVDFVDIDPATYNLDVAVLRGKLKQAEHKGRLPKILIPVHFAGHSCTMREIAVLAKQYGFRVVEDASHAIGGSYLGEPVGCCRYADICVFSFHPVKLITTGEGGMALTNDPELAEAMRRRRSHGITRDPALMQEITHGPWYYQQIELGYNYRMTDIQAALGTSQLSRLEACVKERHRLARRYDHALAGLPLQLPQRHREVYSAFHLYVVGISEQARGRRELFEHLRAAGIGVNVHYLPVYLQPYYQRLFGYPKGYCPVAENYYARALSLPLFPTLTDQQQDHVIEALERLLA